MKIYRVENEKGLGPFYANQKWNWPVNLEPKYSYRNWLIIRDNFYRFGCTSKEQLRYFNFSEILGDKFSISIYEVPMCHIITGIYEVAFNWHAESVHKIQSNIMSIDDII